MRTVIFIEHISRDSWLSKGFLEIQVDIISQRCDWVLISRYKTPLHNHSFFVIFGVVSNDVTELETRGQLGVPFGLRNNLSYFSELLGI